MCGILGIAFRSPAAKEKSDPDLSAAVKSLAHRGPNDSGIYEFSQGYLGHTRLSILDLSLAGHQPMIDEEDDICIVHNGEIYNFPEMKGALERDGARFRSRTDTEVILNAFKARGTSVFPQLNGMFAFAILDKPGNKLILARDRFGIKPLYYSYYNDALVFASEIKAIHALWQNRKSLNIEALHEFIYFGNGLGETTLFSNIRKLLPGTFLELDLGSFNLKQQSYWTLDSVAPREQGKDAIGRTRELLESAVKRQLVSDVPVGIFLSGGIDSTAITAFAAKHYGGRLKTYSVGFDFDKGINELPKARRVARFYGTDHHELHVSGGDLPDIVSGLVSQHDQPFSDAANIPLLLMCRQLEGDAKVILQGDGGDEIFGGYRRYSALGLRQLWRVLRKPISILNCLTPRNAGYFRRRRFWNALGARDDAEAMALLLTVEDRTDGPEAVFSEAVRDAVVKSDPFSKYREYNHRFGRHDIVQRMLYTDTQIILPDIFLEKVDRAAMAESIEVRVPFLDHDLTEYVLSLPSKFKVKNGKKKWLLKAALDGIIPGDILSAPKTGFGVPYGYWLRSSLHDFFQDVLMTSQNSRNPIFDYRNIDRLFREHKSGRRNHEFLLWKVLNLAIWLQQHEL